MADDTAPDAPQTPNRPPIRGRRGASSVDSTDTGSGVESSEASGAETDTSSTPDSTTPDSPRVDRQGDREDDRQGGRQDDNRQGGRQGDRQGDNSQPDDGPALIQGQQASETPKPGEVGYAPPARIASPAGIVLNESHYGYDRGQSQTGLGGQVPLAMPAPAYETVSQQSGMVRPSLLSKATATANWTRMIHQCVAYALDFSHEAHGTEAVMLKTFRDLAARNAARSDASANGRQVEPDEADKAHFSPPPEFYNNRHLAQQMIVMNDTYVRALKDAGGALSPADKSTIDGLLAEFTPLAEGPTSPEEADVKTEEEMTAGDETSPEHHSHMPAGPDQRRVSDRLAQPDPQLTVIEGEPQQPS